MTLVKASLEKSQESNESAVKMLCQSGSVDGHWERAARKQSSKSAI